MDTDPVDGVSANSQGGAAHAACHRSADSSSWTGAVVLWVIGETAGRATRNFRNDLYLVGEAIQLMQKSGQQEISPSEWNTLASYKRHVDLATRFIPGWVKVSVAIALGLGTMIGWKRIVVTVGEKIGKDHLTYAQGAAAEITAMTTIAAADSFGLPVSTTHVLSSAVGGTMAANGSGLQWGTVRNLLMAWVLTLPASIILSGTLYWIFHRFV